MEQDKRELLQTGVIPKLVDVMETVDEVRNAGGRLTLNEVSLLKRVKQLSSLARLTTKELIEGGK